MELTREELVELTRVAAEAARRAGAMIAEAAGKDREVRRKEGGESLASQVVTEVDLESQRIILEVLAPTVKEFELGLLTEESEDDASRHERDHFWCVDPLDGTLPFIEGNPGYAVSIGLVSREGRARAGVILDPVTGTLYSGYEGGGVFRDGVRWAVPEKAEAGGELTLVMDRGLADEVDYDRILEGVETMAAARGLAGVTIRDRGGAAMNACWVIEGAPAVYFKFPKAAGGGGSLWDFAASAALYAEMGAVVSDIHGAPLQLNRNETTYMNTDGVLYASSASLGMEVRALFLALRG